MARSVAEEYASSLGDLTVNSKPLINMLTMLAEDYIDHSPTIVRTVEAHLHKVHGDVKLPVLYLIDSIVKNVGKQYVSLFTQNIVSTFCSVFEQVDERTRSQMFKLRQTWNDVFPLKKLHALDTRVHSIDPAWPIIPLPPSHGRIHLNPKFLNSTTNLNPPVILNPATPEAAPTGSITSMAEKREELLKKQKELLELQKRKVELELLQTKAILEEQQRKLETQTSSLKPEPTSQPLPQPLPPAPQPPTVVPNTKPLKRSSRHELPESSSAKSRSTEPKPEKSKFEGAKRRDPRLHSRREVDPRLSSRKENHQKSNIQFQQDVSNKFPPTHSVGNKDIPKGDEISVESKKSSDSSSPNGSRHQRKKSERYKKHKEKPRMKVLFGDSPEKKLPPSTPQISSSDQTDKTTKIIESSSRTVKDESSSHLTSSIPASREIPAHPVLEIIKDNNKIRKEPKVEKMDEVIEIPDPPRITELQHQNKTDMPTIIDITDIPYCPESEPVPMEIDEKPKDEPEPFSVETRPLLFIKNDETPIFHPPKETEPLIFPVDNLTSDLPPANECGDTDLRLLPQQAKSETEQPPEKKSKADINKLFGEEDVDLRKSLVPPAPPPPIISKSDLELSEGWANIKRTNPEKHSSGKSPKKRKSLVSSPRSSIFRKKDDDIGRHDTMDNDAEDRQNALYIIMKEAEEQLKNETITYAQYNQMLKGVMSMNEESKLQEALMKDELERVDSPDSGSNSSNETPHHYDKDVPSPDSTESFRSHSTGGDGKSVIDDNSSELSKNSNDTNDNLGNDHGSDGSRRRSRFNKSHDQFHNRSKTSRSRFYNQNEPPFYVDNNKPWMMRHQEPPFAHRPRKEAGFRWQFPHNRQNNEYSIIGPPARMRVPRHHPESSLPPADPVVLEQIDNDPMTYITVNNSTKDVRFYGENAIIMLDWDDPRDLMFQPGQRRVFIDGADAITLQFNSQYREITLNYGLRVRIRLGAPTRELFIDGRFYSVKFGGPPVEINLGGRTHLFQLEGPVPFLQIGTTRRTDLVAGKVNLIVDGKIDNIFPIYLDAKPQKFEINSVPFIIRFVEALQTVVINGQPLKIQFGGIPVAITFRRKRHYLRLTSLPPGITPGYVTILNMEGGRLPTPPPPRIGPPPPAINEVVPPLVPPAFMNQAKSYEFQANSQPHFPPTSEFSQYSVSMPPADKPVDVLTSLMPPPVPRFALQNYIVEQPYQEAPATSQSSTTAPVNVPSVGTPSIDVIELYQKLVAMGVVPQKKDKEEPEDKQTIKPVDFSKPDTLKLRQPGLISRLYSGIQCSSCGVRFSPEQTVKYSQHLDWHFRQNRRERNSSRIAQSRRWNYDVSDWIQYQEIEDEEDRAQSWFEIQDKRTGGEEEEEAAESTVPAKGFGENPCCTVCRDKFDQFFNEDKEEWQLKRAVCVEDKLYHPLCLKDEQEKDGRNVVPIIMPVPEDEPIETIDLDAGGDSAEEEKTNIETIDIESSKSPEEEEKSEIMETEPENENPQETTEMEVTPQEEEEEEEENKDEEEKPPEEPEKPPEKMDDDNSDDDILEIEVIKPHIESYDILDDDEEEEAIQKEKMDEDKSPDDTEGKKETSEINEVPEDEEEEVTEVVIKQEKMDHLNPVTGTNTSHINETIYLDGNSEFSAPKIMLPKKIKINISSVMSKTSAEESSNSAPVLIENEPESTTTYDYTEPLPPGEEEVFTGHLKPRLIGSRMCEMPPVLKGKEMSGLCTIM